LRALVFDPFSGISGDMTLGALLDLGLPVEWLRDFVDGLGIARIGVSAERVQRRGIACTRVVLDLPHEHAHRHLKDVVRIIDSAGVDARVRERAVAAFTHLAEAEAAVHGTTPERVHFHEVGALDAIVDILGVMAACRELGVERFYTRPVTLGRGWAEMAHGRFPVPPPAVLRLLEGIAVRDPHFEGECTTPTGAAIVKTLTGGREAPPTFTPVRTGFGAGTRDPSDRPNCLRLLVIEDAQPASEELLFLQADIDDLVPEYVPALIQSTLDAGALDCAVVPILMKKGRPGLRVEALVESDLAAAVRGVLFHASTTLGVRWWGVQREVLPRREERVEWRGQVVRVKRSRLPGGGERAKPEFEDVVRAAEALGMTPLATYRAMLAEGVAVEERSDSLSQA
jgi:pyridinium-3,5-bisthiocarboxylic acid mononucleotide nickel chelatase